MIGTVCLPSESEVPPIHGSIVSVAGWGSDGRAAAFSPLLKSTEVRMVDSEACVEMFDIFGGSVDPTQQVKVFHILFLYPIK